MRAASLLGVFVVAKVCVLVGRDVPLSGWAPIAYLWQDLLVVGLFAAVDYLLRRAWAGWIGYTLIGIYTAINVPVARVLSTPLTWPLLRAARGPLWDSIVAYVTWANVMLMLLVFATAAILPFLLRRLVLRSLVVAAAALHDRTSNWLETSRRLLTRVGGHALDLNNDGIDFAAMERTKKGGGPDG